MSQYSFLQDFLVENAEKGRGLQTMGRSKAALAGLGIVVSVLIMMLLGMRVMADDTNTGSGCNQSGSYGTINWSIEPYNDDGCSLTIGPGQGDDSLPGWTAYTDYSHNLHIVHVTFTDPVHTVFGSNADKAFFNMNLVDSGDFNIKDVDMSHVRTIEGMFANTNMDAPLDLDGDGWHDTANLTTMANMFSGFHAPGIMGIGRMNTSNVTDLSNMFNGSNFGDSVLDVDGMDTSKVRNMNELFHWTRAADIRGFENWDMSSVTSLNQVISAGFKFNRTIDLRKWNLSSMSNFQDTFEDLKADGLDLSGWKMPNFASMSHFFTSADIGKVDVTGWEIGSPCISENQCNHISINEMFWNARVSNVVGVNTWKLNEPTSMNLELWSDKAKEFDFSGLDVRNIMYMQNSIICSPNIQSMNLSNIDFTGKSPKFTNDFLNGVFCNSVEKVNMSSTRFDGSTGDYKFKFPYSMNELTIGKDVHLNDQSMDNVGENHDSDYTGRWVEANAGPNDTEHLWESQSTNPADSAKELAARSREGHAGTYIRQRKVTITYDRNTEDSITGIPNHDETVWPDLGEGIALPKDVNRNGYRFNGWNTAKDGSGRSYKPGERVHLQDNVTLYAQWNVRTKTAIRFNANGGDPDTKPEDIETGTRTSIAIPCGTIPTMPGNTFIGWSRTKSPVLSGTDAGRNGKVEACGYSKNTSIAMQDDESIDLYAVWARKPKAVFNENRPKDMTAQLPETKTITGDWYMSGLTPRTYVGSDIFGWYKGYSPDGVYQFDGWTNEDGTPFTGANLDRDDVTINAKWTRIANDTSGNGDTDDNSSDPGNGSNHSGNNNSNAGQTNENPSDHSDSSGNTANQNGSGQPSSSSGTTTNNDSEANNQQTFDSSPNSSGSTPSTESSNADNNNESKEPSNDEATTETVGNEDPTVRSVPLAKTGASVIGSIAMSVLLMVIGFGAVMTARRHHSG